MSVYKMKPTLNGEGGGQGGSSFPGYTFKCTGLHPDSTIVFGGDQLTFKSLTECEEYKIGDYVYQIPNVFGFINGSSGGEELTSGFIISNSYRANLEGIARQMGTIYQLFADTEMEFVYE